MCDAGGRLMAFNRMDGAIWGSVYGSQGKAIASAAFGRASGELTERAGSPIIQGIAAAEGGHMIPSMGAVPIITQRRGRGRVRRGRRDLAAGRGRREGGRREAVGCSLALASDFRYARRFREPAGVVGLPVCVFLLDSFFGRALACSQRRSLESRQRCVRRFRSCLESADFKNGRS